MNTGRYYERIRILIVDNEPDIVLTLLKILLHNRLEQVDTFIDPLLALRKPIPIQYYSHHVSTG